eukprot:m.308468 g.308468  ORF g.308468 m.308468 type:complete len:998 (+) comp44045_c0_seq1:170-3163(+)
MLTVFLVDTGRLVHLDIQYAMGSVAELQFVLVREFQVPVEKQVLLSSNGVALVGEAKVASFSCGTDTHPVFLYNKSNMESLNPPVYPSYVEPDGEMLSRLRASRGLRPCHETLSRRVQLAAAFDREASKLSATCSGLWNDQEMQKMGWEAAVENLEKSGRSFKERTNDFCKRYEKFLGKKAGYCEELQRFEGSLSLLKDILLPSSLLDVNRVAASASAKSGDKFQLVDKQLDTEEVDHPVTLLDWISMHDSKCAIESLGRVCQKSLDHVNEGILQETMKRVKDVVDKLLNPGMKEVGGLGERLSQLKEQLRRVQDVEQEQSVVAQGWKKNLERAKTVQDPTIYPDLCASHDIQLEHLANNHQKLKQFKMRFFKAKQELCANLHLRMRWLMAMQKNICDCDSQVILQLENLRQTRQKFEVILQINKMPLLYLKSVEEVVRRQLFNEQFSKWAANVSGLASQTRAMEVERRREFSDLLGAHFVQGLFPGISKMPSKFAIDPPLPPTGLPVLSQSYLGDIKAKMPDQAEQSHVDLSSAVDYYKIAEESDSERLSECQVEIKRLEGLIEEQRKTFDLKLQDAEESGCQKMIQKEKEWMSKSESVTSEVKSELEVEKSKLKIAAETLERKEIEIEISRRSQEQIENEKASLHRELEACREGNRQTEGGEEKLRSCRESLEKTRVALEESRTICANLQANWETAVDDLDRMKRERADGDAEWKRRMDTAAAEVRLEMVREIDVLKERHESEVKVKVARSVEAAKKEAESFREQMEKALGEAERLKEGFAVAALNASLGPAESVDGEDVVKKLMEKERDLKEKQRHADEVVGKAEKVLKEKKEFEERSTKRSKEIEASYQEMEKHLVDMTDVLAKNGVTYKLPSSYKTRPSLALIDFKIGDVALFVLSPERDAYLAFTPGSGLYFLHPDSVVQLGLLEESSGQRKSQVLARITDKEFCLCKKKSNRLKLPVGFKFYRLKAVPFDLDGGKQKQAEADKSLDDATQ